MSHKELFGLPGVGKSFWLRTRLNAQNDVRSDLSVLVESRSIFSKTYNICRGLFSNPLVINNIARIFLCVSVRQVLPLVRSCLIVVERLGQHNSDRCDVDEGLLQATWGVLFRANMRVDDETRFALAVIRAINKDTKIVYICTSKITHQRRYFQRVLAEENDFFGFNDPKIYKVARHKMAFLLRLCRSEGVRVIRAAT